MCSSLPSPYLHACIHHRKWGRCRPGGAVFIAGGLDGNKVTRRIKWIFLWRLSKYVSICRGRKAVKNFSTGDGKPRFFQSFTPAVLHLGLGRCSAGKVLHTQTWEPKFGFREPVSMEKLCASGCSVSLALENRDMRDTGALCSGTIARITSCRVNKRPHIKNKNHHHQQQKIQVEKLLRMIHEIRHWPPHVHTQKSKAAQAHTSTHIKTETFNKP